MDEFDLEQIEQILLPERCREIRDELLKMHVDILNGPRWVAMTPEKQQEWVQYREDLLNVPQQEGFPTDIIWPTLPE